MASSHAQYFLFPLKHFIARQTEINLSNENLLAYKSISWTFCGHSDVVQIIYHQQNLIVLEIQDKKSAATIPAACTAAQQLHTQTFQTCYTTR